MGRTGEKIFTLLKQARSRPHSLFLLPEGVGAAKSQIGLACALEWTSYEWFKLPVAIWRSTGGPSLSFLIANLLIRGRDEELVAIVLILL